MDRRTGVLARVPEAYYSEERQAIVETARAFAMKEVLPVANRLDPVQGEMPMGLRDKMAELGYFGILIPQEYGGLGLGLFEYVLVTEELARAWMSVASIIARGNGIGAGFSEEKRKEMLPKMARGECLGAFALSEPGAGSDVAAIRCRAELVGDQWVVNGQKMWCTFADGADFIILVARATPYDPEHRHAGIAQFLIEKERGTFPPGIAGTPMRKVGYHGWKTWELSFDNFRIPKENILLHAARSGSSEGFKRTAMALSVARIHTAARSVGLARGRSRTRSPTRRRGSSSAGRSATSRRSGSSSRGWRPRSRPRARSPTPPPTTSITGGAPTWRRPWRSSSRAR